MAWNIAVLCTEGSQELVQSLIPDIFDKSKDFLFFEEATSSSVGNGLTVGYKDGKIIIIDVLGRFISNEKFPAFVSERNLECKVFYISENAVFRQYKNGAKVRDISGREATADELRSLGIEPIDEWGETMSFQLLEYEIFGVKIRKTRDPFLWDIKYDLYEMD